MKIIKLIIVLFISSISLTQIQRVKFNDASFENGMLYPVVVIERSQENADKINTHLQAQIQDLKEADFCIGQFGYVQKGKHIQIHIFCNCIDFEESQNRYYLYNAETGENVHYVNIIDPHKTKNAIAFFEKKAETYAELNSIKLSAADKKLISSNSIDAFIVVFKREGVDLWLKTESWGEKPLFIAWVEMHKIMKYAFL